jgi:hypothetical protein
LNILSPQKVHIQTSVHFVNVHAFFLKNCIANGTVMSILHET